MWKTIFCSAYPEVVTSPKNISAKSFFAMHITFAIVLVIAIIFKIVIKASEIYRYFTLWAMCFTTAYYILVMISYVHGRNYDSKNYKNLQTKEHFYYNQTLCGMLRISFSIQFITVVVFYMVMAPYLIIKYTDDPAYLMNLNKTNIFYNWTTHGIPFAFNIAELSYSSITFPVLQFVWPLLFCGIFVVADYFFVTRVNNIAYPILLDW